MFQIPVEENARGSSDSLTAHSTDLAIPVFHDDPEPTITIQPRMGDSYPGTRRPVPVSTQEWQGLSETHFIPMHGLDFLSGTNKIHIQQTIELHDLLEDVGSENRYTIKTPRGDTIYYATEISSSFQRTCIGSNRAFQMTLFDQTRQEALMFKRRLACGACSFWCYLQSMEVWAHPGELVGDIRQEMSIGTPIFSVYNRHGFVIYKIEGPKSCMCGVYGKDAHFKMFSADGATQIGSINHQWDQVLVDYILCVEYPSNIEVRHKALLVGAAFLLEYMYFENIRSVNCCRC